MQKKTPRESTTHTQCFALSFYIPFHFWPQLPTFQMKSFLQRLVPSFLWHQHLSPDSRTLSLTHTHTATFSNPPLNPTFISKSLDCHPMSLIWRGFYCDTEIFAIEQEEEGKWGGSSSRHEKSKVYNTLFTRRNFRERESELEESLFNKIHWCFETHTWN